MSVITTKKEPLYQNKAAKKKKILWNRRERVVAVYEKTLGTIVPNIFSH